MSEPEPEQDERELDFILLSTVTVKEYWDSKLDQRSIAVDTEGDQPLTTLLGNLEYAKWQLLQELAGDDDEDE